MTRKNTKTSDHAAPSSKELERRRRLLKTALRSTVGKPFTTGPFPSAEEMLRQDRER
jgi:hypothetical protein